MSAEDIQQVHFICTREKIAKRWILEDWNSFLNFSAIVLAIACVL